MDPVASEVRRLAVFQPTGLPCSSYRVLPVIGELYPGSDGADNKLAKAEVPVVDAGAEPVTAEPTELPGVAGLAGLAGEGVIAKPTPREAKLANPEDKSLSMPRPCAKAFTPPETPPVAAPVSAP